MRACLIFAAGIALATGTGTGGAPAAAQPREAGTSPCARLVFDLRTGTLNGLAPATAMAKVKRRLPCFTGETTEGEVANHGGGVFFLNDDFYFYTYLRFIELRAGFSGETRPRLFGRTRGELGRALPFVPTGSTRPYWSTASDEFVPSRSGCVQFVFEGERLVRLRSYSARCGSIRSVD